MENYQTHASPNLRASLKPHLSRSRVPISAPVNGVLILEMCQYKGHRERLVYFLKHFGILYKTGTYFHVCKLLWP